jgi:hypothetical protein
MYVISKYGLEKSDKCLDVDSRTAAQEMSIQQDLTGQA